MIDVVCQSGSARLAHCGGTCERSTPKKVDAMTVVVTIVIMTSFRQLRRPAMQSVLQLQADRVPVQSVDRAVLSMKSKVATQQFPQVQIQL